MRTFYLFLGLILCWSCEKANLPKPENAISKSKMVELLADLYLQQSLTQNEVANQSIEEYAKSAWSVLQKHEVSYEQFESSYKYYCSDPAIMNDLLSDAKDKLVSMLSPEAQKLRDEKIKEQKAQEEAMKKNMQ